MSDHLTTELCIVGDQPGGLRAALVAGAFGVPTILIRDPSSPPNFWATRQAFLASGRAAHAMHRAALFGLQSQGFEIDEAAIKQRAADYEQHLGLRDSKARLQALGVRVIEGHARFDTTHSVCVGAHHISARRFILALPPRLKTHHFPVQDKGTDAHADFSLASFLKQSSLPKRLAIIGRDQAALEWAQALHRLKREIHLIAPQGLLPGEDRELIDLMSAHLRREGLMIHTHHTIQQITRDQQGGSWQIALAQGAETHWLACDDVLQLEMQQSPFDDYGFALAGIGAGSHGIRVNRHLRTDNPAIFAIGACAALDGLCRGPHAERHQADLVMRQILFRWPLTYDPLSMPRAVLTEPEWACVGLTEDQARARHGTLSVLRSSFADNDRAMAEGLDQGHAKILLDRRGRLVGASLLGPYASELIAPWASQLGQKPKPIKKATPPSPSFAETPRRALTDADAPLARSKAIRWISQALRRWG